MITRNTLRYTNEDLEGNLIPFERYEEAPEIAQRLAREGTEEGVPTGIGYCNSLGWYVCCSAGQGPCLVWKEGNEEPPTKEEREKQDVQRMREVISKNHFSVG